MERIEAKEKILQNKLSYSGLNNIYIACYEEVDSTMNVASQIATKVGLNNFALVSAERQTAGRGRNDHIWESPKNGNLYFTFLINVKSLPKDVSSFSLIVSVVLLDVIKEKLGIQEDKLCLKWPNDILDTKGKKLSGILIETEKNQNGYTIMIGIGLNITDAPCTNSVSLSEITNVGISKEEILADIILSISDAWRNFNKKGFKDYKDIWLKYCGYIGKQIEICSTSIKEKGKMVGINDVGALLLDVDGTIKEYYSGDVYTRV